MNLKNKKKIRIVIGSLNVGGTEKQLLNIVNYLAKKSWKIELITLKERGILAKYLNKEIKTNNLNIKTSFKVISFFKIIHKLFKIFKKDPFTLTHFFLPQAYILGMISSIIANSKCKLIMSRRSLNFYQNKIIFCRIVEKFLHKKVDKILVNSKAIKKQLINHENVSKDRIKIIYNGIDVTNKKKFQKNNNFNIVITANLIPYKNHHILFNSLNLIKEKLPKNWRLYCIGRDDGIKKKLVKLSKKLKIFNKVTWIETLELENILSNCNLGILCSKEEGFPNAILEYFKFKLPVIATNVGGCNEIIKNRKNGILTSKNDVLGLSKAIIYLYKNKDVAKKISSEGFKTAKNKFRLNETINDHEKEYLKCLRS